MFIEDLKRPILKVWDLIGGDVLAATSQSHVDTETVLEMCIDAGRLRISDPVAGRLAGDLIDLHGWDGFVSLIKPFIDPGGHDCWG
jgi:hypothetical protein